MRCGCIALGTIQCDGCHRFLKYGERYLLSGDEGNDKQRFCVECCLSHGDASYIVEKAEEEITFLNPGKI